MKTVNKVIIVGNIVRVGNIRTTKSGKKVILFVVATNRYYKTVEGEVKSDSEFHNCVVWGSLAERLHKYLAKGKLVYVEGRLKTRILEARDNLPKTIKTEIIVSNLIFLNKRTDFENVEDHEIDEMDEE